MKKGMNRREFLKASGQALAAMSSASLLFPRMPAQAQPLDIDPHFFIHILIPGGVDSSYLFDARPLSMSTETQPWIQNYLGIEPILLEDTKGNSCWASPAARSLIDRRDQFSIVNGILMSNGLDGHDQILNLACCHNGSGGEYFSPSLAHSPQYFSVTQFGNTAIRFSNTGQILAIQPGHYSNLRGQISTTSLTTNSALQAYLQERYQNAGQGQNVYSQSSQELTRALNASPSLVKLFKSFPALDVGVATSNQMKLWLEESLKVVEVFFKSGFSQNALIILPDFAKVGYDAHDFNTAKQQPQNMQELSETLALFFDFLKRTPFGTQGKSMGDVCSFLIHSEFSRTMRQGDAIKETGTDHNTLSNMALIGGKGVRTGQIWGQSDFRTHDEKLSPARLKRDSSKRRLLGKPFDLGTGLVKNVLPELYAVEDYLCWPNLINTFRKLHGVSEKQYWTYAPFKDTAPPVAAFLST